MHRKKIFKTVLLCMAIVAILLQSAAFAEDEKKAVRIGYHFTTDYSQKYKAEFSQTYEVDVYSFYSFWDMEYTERCTKAIDDTLFHMEIEIHKISGSSKRNDDLTESEAAKEMLGQKFTFNINHNGMFSELYSAEYLDNEAEALAVLQTMLSATYPYVPDTDISIGGDWEFDGSTVVDSESDYDIESLSKFEVEELKKEKGRQCFKIKVKSENYISGRIEGEEGMMVIDGEGDGQSEFYFDIENAIIVKYKSKTDALITTIQASGSSAEERGVQEFNIIYNVKRELK